MVKEKMEVLADGTPPPVGKNPMLRPTKNQNSNHSQLSWVERILLRLAGVDPSSVSDKDLSEVRFGYMALAQVTIMVASLAGMSMAFAVSTLTNNVWIYSMVGVVWSLSILTLDYFLIVTLKANHLLAFIPAIIMRAVLAVSISLLVSVPFELRIFKTEIENKISKSAATEFSQDKSRLMDEYAIKLDGLGKEKKSLEDQIDARKAECREKYNIYIREGTGVESPDTSGKTGIGERALLDKQLYEQCKKDEELETDENINGSMASRLKDIKDQIANLESERDKRIAYREKAINEENGLAARIKALDQVTEENAEVKFIHWVLRLVIIMLETLPLSGKIFLFFTDFENFRTVKQNTILQKNAKMLKTDLVKAHQKQVSQVLGNETEQETINKILVMRYLQARSQLEKNPPASELSRKIADELNELTGTAETFVVSDSVNSRSNGSGQTAGKINGNR